MKIITSDEDNFLYDYLLKLLDQVKLVQGGTALSSTLRRHSKIKNYMIEKQRLKLNNIEEKYFMKNGELNQFEIENYLARKESTRQFSQSNLK